MPVSKSSRVLFGVFVVALAVAVYLRFTMVDPPKPPPSAPGYYTGPLRSKGDPNSVADEDGKRYTLPPITPSASASSQPDVPKKDAPKKEDTGSSTP